VGTVPLSLAAASGQKDLLVSASGVLGQTLELHNQALRCDPDVVITWTFSEKKNAIEVIGNVAIIGCRLRFVPTTPSVVPVDADGPHAVSMRGASGLRLESCRVEGFLGDGAYLGPGRDASRAPSSGVTVRDCAFIGNGRQGMSIVSAKDVIVENCTFENTKGSSPESGMDLEPANLKDQLVNIKITDCVARNNNGGAYLVNATRLTGASPAVSVEFLRCGGSDIGSKYPLRVIGLGPEDATPPPGYVTFDGLSWGTPP